MNDHNNCIVGSMVIGLAVVADVIINRSGYWYEFISPHADDEWTEIKAQFVETEYKD